MSLAILFHYFEADAGYRDNLLHFLTFGWRPDARIHIILSGDCSVPLPNVPNVSYIRAPNRNHDYGGYATALAGPVDPAVHDHVIFINASVRGPYLPPWAGEDWTRAFIAPFARGDVGVVGATINILDSDSGEAAAYAARHGGRRPFSHVQSTAFCLSRDSLNLLVNQGFFANQTALAKPELIADYEIGLSQTLLRAGRNLACLLPEYDGIDYRQPHRDINPTSIDGDPSYANACFGRTLHPYECLFIKTHRGLWPQVLFDRLSLTRLRAGIALPEVHWNDSIRSYVARLAATDMAAPLPSVVDQLKATALDAIIRDVNALLTQPPPVTGPGDGAKAWCFDQMLAILGRHLTRSSG